MLRAIRLLAVLGVALALSGCTKAQTTTATGIGVTVATDVCKELEKQPEPDWVLLACTVEQIGAGIIEGGALGEAQTVRIRIPRAQWTAMHARAFDASPGK